MKLIEDLVKHFLERVKREMNKEGYKLARLFIDSDYNLFFEEYQKHRQAGDERVTDTLSRLLAKLLKYSFEWKDLELRTQQNNQEEN